MGATAPKKGTKATEVVVGTAAVKLNQAVKNLQEAMASAGNLEETITGHVLKAEELEGRISDLQNTYENNKKQMAFDMDLEYKSNQKAFAEKYLSTTGLTAVPTEDWQGVNAELNNIKTEFNNKVNSEVGKVRGQLENSFKQDKQILELNFQAKEADNNAKITQKDQQIAFLTDQVNNWKSALDAERQAGIQRAQASSIGTLNVGSPAGR